MSLFAVSDDSDYIEFSTAEAMVAAGGDPRLQALRKRLQAKKELLKQLNRMYTSFLGGNAAASKLGGRGRGSNGDQRRARVCVEGEGIFYSVFLP